VSAIFFPYLHPQKQSQALLEDRQKQAHQVANAIHQKRSKFPTKYQLYPQIK
jgi:hypothetical protein